MEGTVSGQERRSVPNDQIQTPVMERKIRSITEATSCSIEIWFPSNPSKGLREAVVTFTGFKLL